MLELRMIGMKNKDQLKKYWFTLTVIQVNNTKLFTLSVIILTETAPQFCVVAIILSENFTMDINKPYRPRPSCMTCQVDDYNSRLLKGVPFLVGYGLQPSNNGKIMR